MEDGGSHGAGPRVSMGMNRTQTHCVIASPIDRSSRSYMSCQGFLTCLNGGATISQASKICRHFVENPDLKESAAGTA